MKVFLSSTAQDLVAYRQVADDTILRLSQQAVAMERFGPLPGAPVEECERLARESDVVVCIVAHRYGFEPEKGRGSITRREVEAAKLAGRDVLVWIVADEHPWTEKKEQDLLTDPTARAEDVVARVRALGDFKAWLRANFVCDTFTTPDELGRKLAVALSTRSARQPSAAAQPARRQGEIRIVHALQPAPHFHGREALVSELARWVADPASPDRVWSVVAAGGTGKTAIVERVVRELQLGEANVLVWSFYERPEADAFLRECNQLFLGEEDGQAGGRLERLERGLRDGQPHVIVMDGLERVQEDAGSGRVRGELSDQTLKLLFRVLASGLGRARALVTSRFPLVDLRDWDRRGYRETRLDDLTPSAAVAVLRGWGVQGDEAALRATASQVGYHALSVAVIGSYLQSFAEGRIEEVQRFDLDSVAGDDPKAAKLARVLAFYADGLPAEERELMARIAVFPRGVTTELLGVLIDAGREVAGVLANARARLPRLLASLRARGLVFEYRGERGATWTAHPFLRETFRELLDCRPEWVFNAVSKFVGKGLKRRPRETPADPALLDRYESLLEALHLAGREQEAFDLFWRGMGGVRPLIGDLGEYQRSYRILSLFSPTGKPENAGQALPPKDRSELANTLAVVAARLGRLEEARAIHHVDNTWRRSVGDVASFASALETHDSGVVETELQATRAVVKGLLDASAIALSLGRLAESRSLAEMALADVSSRKRAIEGFVAHHPGAKRYRFTDFESIDFAAEGSFFANLLLEPIETIETERGTALLYRAMVSHALGDTRAARSDFESGASRFLDDRAEAVAFLARHQLDCGDIEPAVLGFIGADSPLRGNHQLNAVGASYEAVLARGALAKGEDPRPHIESLREWTARTGDVALIIEAHLLSALQFLGARDLQGALAEADTGLSHAVSCGFRLLQIELLIALARIKVAWPDPASAIQAAREALDLATHPDCQYAWGEANASQVWGEAYFANHEPDLARRAFTQALAVRKRIEHPGVAETERWLGITEEPDRETTNT